MSRMVDRAVHQNEANESGVSTPACIEERSDSIKGDGIRLNAYILQPLMHVKAEKKKNKGIHIANKEKVRPIYIHQRHVPEVV